MRIKFPSAKNKDVLTSLRNKFKFRNPMELDMKKRRELTGLLISDKIDAAVALVKQFPELMFDVVDFMRISSLASVKVLVKLHEDGLDISSANRAITEYMCDETKWSKNIVSTKNDIAESLESAARKGINVSFLIPGILPALSYNNSAAVRKRAAELFMNLGQHGVDFSSAIKDIKRAFYDKNKEVAWFCAIAAAYYCINKKEWGKVRELLVHKRSNVRRAMLVALSGKALADASVAVMLPDIIKKLSDKSSGARADAAGVLHNLSNLGVDISNAYPDLLRMINDKNSHAAVWALTVFYSLAHNGKDISFTVPAIIKVLDSKDIGLLDHAVAALDRVGNKADMSIGFQKLAKLTLLVFEKIRSRRPEDWTLGETEENELFSRIMSVLRHAPPESFDGIREAIVPELINALSSINESIRNKAIEVLGIINDERALTTLIRLLDASGSSLHGTTKCLDKVISSSKSLDKLDEAKSQLINLAESARRGSPHFEELRTAVSELLLSINRRKNELSVVDLRLDDIPKLFRTPKKPPQGGTYRFT